MEPYKDYMLMLTPSPSVCGQVKKFKQASKRLIGDFEGMNSKAHITLKVSPRQKPFWTEPLFGQLEKELSLIEPFTLQINGFAHFLPTDYTTIYAAILSTPAMEDWFKRLRKCINEKKSVPHITIARQLPNDLAKKLWPKFKDRPWNDQFKIDRLTILYRETYGYDRKWQKLRDIALRGNPELNSYTDKKQEKLPKPVDQQQISLF